MLRAWATKFNRKICRSYTPQQAGVGVGECVVVFWGWMVQTHFSRSARKARENCLQASEKTVGESLTGLHITVPSWKWNIGRMQQRMLNCHGLAAQCPPHTGLAFLGGLPRSASVGHTYVPVSGHVSKEVIIFDTKQPSSRDVNLGRHAVVYALSDDFRSILIIAGYNSQTTNMSASCNH